MVILAEPERYKGLPLTWARLWLERAKKAAAVIGRGPKSPQGIIRPSLTEKTPRG
jgi:hypothetical protein